jgi:hypothetical protein
MEPKIVARIIRTKKETTMKASMGTNPVNIPYSKNSFQNGVGSIPPSAANTGSTADRIMITNIYNFIHPPLSVPLAGRIKSREIFPALLLSQCSLPPLSFCLPS